MSERTSGRYRRIVRFAAGVLAATWWFDIFLPRIGLARYSERTRPARARRAARRFHALAVDLGGLMIKVGQFLSSRLDVLPPEVTAELAGLQDEVPAVPFAQIREAAEAELGMPLASAFASIDEHPLAAASLGQAHRATLTPALAADAGFTDVVVKIQRPGIAEIVEIDLAALRRIGGWLARVRVVAARVDAPALVEEFAATSRQEIDYRNEARNAERFRAAFVRDGRVGVPEVAWERSTSRVLTLSDVTAIKITDADALRAAGIDPRDVAAGFGRVMFEQLFTLGFFHADPHPGNVFVTPGDLDEASGRRTWQLTFIDFGMMGEVSPQLRAGLRKVLLAVAARDGRALVSAISDVGVLLPSADTRDLERAMTALFARFGGMGFAQLRDVDPREFRAFADEFGDAVRALPFQLPENFLLIVRAGSLTSGVCTALDPEYNAWDALEPFAATLLRQESGGMVRDAASQAMGVAQATWRLPGRLDALITRVDDGYLTVDTSRLEKRITGLELLARRILAAVLFGVFLIAGVLLRGIDQLGGDVLMIVSALPLLYTLFAGFFRRR
ncbi:AarF/UbiB family protein [uncultured Microbacterium sp.]|uniref:ABC1 kinase family protein n=1 Tax=uncultured Microbacterium sp. TaxID=191216 RepID=UPI0025CBD1F6|nr:AarF/UbiB family protein [uncultured Microbacterium sp.]